MVDGERLANGRVFVNMGAGIADGIRCDVDGNIWAGAGWGGEDYNGVHIISPAGELIGKIHLPEICANICFGGAKRDRLFHGREHVALFALCRHPRGTETIAKIRQVFTLSVISKNASAGWPFADN